MCDLRSLIRDVPSEFLDEKIFSRLEEWCPLNGWKTASVYSVKKKHDIVHQQTRHAEKIVENPEISASIVSLLHSRVMSLFSDTPMFVDGWIRPDQVEWLRYTKGMYFHAHRDFERFSCNGMIPMSLLIGFSTTTQGGETIIEDVTCTGSARRNGAVCFPSGLLHRSNVVSDGIKLCLKLELLLFFSLNPFLTHVRVSDGDDANVSFWMKDGLDLIDNYISCKRDFIGSSGSTVVLDETEASGLKECMISMGLVAPSHPSMDFFFPSLDQQTVRDLFLVADFLQNEKQKLIMCSSSVAWDIINHKMNLSERGCGACVVLWHREDRSVSFTLDDVVNRCGEYFPISPYIEAQECSHVVNFEIISHSLIHSFINKKNISPENDDAVRFCYPLKKSSTDAPPAHVVCCSKVFSYMKKKRTLFPSDDTTPPVFLQGDREIEEREMCNDSESGYTTYRYNSYCHYDFYPRWMIVRTSFF